MGYRVIITAAAKKQLSKIDRQSQKAIYGFLVELEGFINPRSTGIAMQGAGHLWRYRVGDYRIIAEIEDKTITITVAKIGHRKDVYR